MANANERLNRFFNDEDAPKAFAVLGTPTESRAALSPSFLVGSTPKSTIAADIPRTSSPLSYSAPSDQSTVSSSSPRSSTWSRRDTSSTISTVPEQDYPEPTLDQHLMNMTLHGTEPVYSCIFNFVGCSTLFEPHDFDNWYAHSLSHLGKRPRPPTYTRCIFCSAMFENEDAMVCWQQSMSHIADHLDNGRTVEHNARPDFALIKHLYREGLIDAALYEELQNGNERPRLDGFCQHDYIPQSIKKKEMERERRDNRVIVTDPRRSRRTGHHSSRV